MQFKQLLTRPADFALMCLLSIFAVGVAVSGTTGVEFQSLYQLALDWASGYLGRGLAIIALLVGLGAGMVRGTVMPAIVGVAMAVAFAVGPQVINGILSATI